MNLRTIPVADRVASSPLDGGSDFLQAIVHGLSQPQKSIPSRFFYDIHGSRLFEQITALDEYYPTRAELEILNGQGGAIAKAADGCRALVEFGAGSSRKVRRLLAAMPQIDVYAPIDISAEFLSAEAQTLAADFPAVTIMPVSADFMAEFSLPADLDGRRRLVFFPGSTIGNFDPRDALYLLERMGEVAGPDGHVLVGVDLKKDEATLLRAYDDAQGVTAAFNLNLLVRANRELGANFDPAAFRHEARYNRDQGRIEMHLVASRRQTATIRGYRFEFAPGESIHTENSYKYTVDEFRLLARASGLQPIEIWLDAQRRFAVHLLRPDVGEALPERQADGLER